MLQRLAVAVLVTAAARAPAAECAASPLFTVTGSNPVMLTFEHLTTGDPGGAQVSIAGNTITVHQFLSALPAPPAALGDPAPACNRVTVSLGALPAGIYHVIWNYSVPPALSEGRPQPRETFTFSFTIVNTVKHCATAPPLFVLQMTLQSSPNDPASLRLHYENSFAGVAPQYGPVTVSRFENTISIVQEVTDVAPSAGSVVCHAEDVELGQLTPGIYQVRVMHVSPVGGDGTGALLTGAGGFIIGANGTVQCTTTREFSLPSAPIPGSPLTVKSNVMTRGFYSGTDLLFRNGFTFYVLDRVTTEFPTTYVPYCLTSAVSLGTLPSGTYIVKWGLNDFGISRPDGEGTFLFTVAAPARHRASGK